MRSVTVFSAIERTAPDGSTCRFLSHKQAGKSVGKTGKQIREACKGMEEFDGYWWRDNNTPEGRPEGTRSSAQLGLVMRDWVWVCFDSKARVVLGVVHGDPPVPAAYVQGFAREPADTLVKTGLVRTTDLYLNATKFADDHGESRQDPQRRRPSICLHLLTVREPCADVEFLSWFTRHQDGFRAIAPLSGMDINGVLACTDGVTEGPDLARGVWVSQQLAMSLAAFVSEHVHLRLRHFYSRLQADADLREYRERIADPRTLPRNRRARPE